MDIFKLLVHFYDAIEGDARISVTHISLYMALLKKWQLNGGVNPFDITRDEVMKTAKIYGRHTYNRCMRELNEYGYIEYLPSFNPFVNSRVSMIFSLSKNGQLRQAK